MNAECNRDVKVEKWMIWFNFQFKMVDSDSFNVLQNCTIEVLNQFSNLSAYNQTEIKNSNRSALIEILNNEYDKYSTVNKDSDKFT